MTDEHFAARVLREYAAQQNANGEQLDLPDGDPVHNSWSGEVTELTRRVVLAAYEKNVDQLREMLVSLAALVRRWDHAIRVRTPTPKWRVIYWLAGEYQDVTMDSEAGAFALAKIVETYAVVLSPNGDRVRLFHGGTTEGHGAARPVRDNTTRPAEVKAVLIGSAVGCDLRLPADAGVSPHHARVTRTPAGLVVEDLGSINGTWIHRAPAVRVVGATPLPRGDGIAVGAANVSWTNLDRMLR
jgi:FHA domain